MPWSHRLDQCVCIVNSSGERKGQLLEQLEHLSQAEQETLKNHILSYHGVFALDASELGTTDVTKHAISTGTWLHTQYTPRVFHFSAFHWWEGMRQVVNNWTQACVICTTYRVGRKVKPSLTPILVSGAFNRVGVDVLQLPKTKRGNRYAVVFVDHLTKWPEVFAVPDQTSATTAGLLVEEVISCHRVPSKIPSDQGKSFLSGLMKEVEVFLGYSKVNTIAYIPSTDQQPC